MENIGQIKKHCEEKKIFAQKMASEKKSNFKVQDTTKSVKQKRCDMIRLNVPNFLCIWENPLID